MTPAPGRIRSGRIASAGRPPWRLAAAGLACLAAWATSPSPAAPGKPKAPVPPRPSVNFAREVLPVLAENCFACHGPDPKQRKAKLRLDTKAGLTVTLRSGNAAVVPGKPGESELLRRITSDDPGKVMPPHKTGKRLTPAQVALVRRWIEEGATWSQHWAFVPPSRPPVPAVADAGRPRNPIDRFVQARLEREGLTPAPEADRATLLRRVTLDLTGLPPTPAELDAFLADPSPTAYDRVVDRLLASPRYGEHMARYWLDAARYGDTHGLHLDNYREMWPYRQWVIQAFNANLPFDRFATEQIAGDMLPGATPDQVIASGFNRCHVTTNEGGAIEEEWYVRNVVDRVDTTGTVFLGLTVGCARCHDHKYDPIRMREFYSLFAFFNSLDEKPLDDNAARVPPLARVGSPAQLAELARLDSRVASARSRIAAEVARVHYEEPAAPKEARPAVRAEYAWVDDDLPAGVRASTDSGPDRSWSFVSGPGHPVFSGTRSVLLEASGLSQHFFMNARPGLRVGADDVLFAHVFLDPKRPPREIMLQWNTGEWRHRAYWGENQIAWGADGTGERRRMGPLPPAGRWVRLDVEASRVGMTPGMEISGLAFTQYDGVAHWDRSGIVSQLPQADQAFASLAAWLRAQETAGGAGLPGPVRDAVRSKQSKRTDAQKKLLRDHFIEHVYPPARDHFRPLHERLAAAEKARDDLEKQIPTTLVAHEADRPRPAFILKRGEYDQKGEAVARATPAFLPPLPPGAPLDRRGLARWLVADDNPLTARVAVNRLWQQVFGTGLVKTTEDFGTQGERPSHPELLDWLAVRFREDGWDVKKTMRRIVTSATYRQASRAAPEQWARDPANRLLARGPRFRLDAEVVRDQALAAGGLLVEHLGGPSVKPPQPAGLWEAVGYVTSNTVHFVADQGPAKVHRRSLYTFWKRTAPPPQMTAFDAPSRETCVARRERTDTPLQALLLLNEQQFVEAARGLARRALREGGSRAEDRAAYLFRLATGRRPDAAEAKELLGTFRDYLATYRRDPAAARALLAVGEAGPGADPDVAEWAAWTLVGNLVLNLDEVINKG